MIRGVCSGLGRYALPLIFCLAAWVSAPSPLTAGERLINGDFEGSFDPCGGSGDDFCPQGGTLFETRDFEDSQAIPVGDNGPSVPGSFAWDFDRVNGGTSDWTALQQNLTVDALNVIATLFDR